MYKQFWVVLIVMMILSPLGILAQGAVWGEWTADELKETLGYVPKGIEHAGDLWHAMFPDYSVPFLSEWRFAEQTGYILSAITGSVVIYGVTTALIKALGLSKKTVHGQ